MKIRTGFVSNSSSSSFLVIFSIIPTTVDEVHALMFPEGETGVGCYDYGMTSKQVAQTVFADILASDGPIGREAMIDEVLRGSFKGQPEHPRGIWDLPQPEREAAYEKYEDESRAAATKLVDKFLGEHAAGAVFLFEYEDKGNNGVVMEHGNVFRRLPHIRVSKH